MGVITISLDVYPVQNLFRQLN